MERPVVRCGNCHDLICVLKDNFPSHTEISTRHVDQTLGQAPWYESDKMCCRKCGEPFRFGVHNLLVEEFPDNIH